MKTFKDIQKEIEIASSGMYHGAKSLKRQNKKVEELKKLKYYLETNPSEESLRNQLEQIGKQIDGINKNYAVWKNTAPKDVSPKKWGAIFDKETGVKDLKARQKTLKYLLDI